MLKNIKQEHVFNVINNSLSVVNDLNYLMIIT